jgi:acyl-CoA reductase-like NAD-dependent aldehyde dehydrogenase
MKHQPLYIDGAWQDGRSTFDVCDPWDGTVVGRVAVADAERVRAAVAAAASAVVPPAHRRAEVLDQVAAFIAGQAEDFAQTIRAEAGKPITAARAEVARAVQTLALSAGEARSITGDAIGMDAAPGGEELLAFTLQQPVGPVAAITPFNFPLNLVAHKVGPAIAAGCPVLLKPSEKTPLTAGMMVDAFDRCGLSPGMLNLVTGDPAEIVEVWADDPRVSVFTFTGSAAVGWALKARSLRKRHILELGSNTAMVVAVDADLDAAVAAAISAGFTFSGQVCVSLQRLYVAAPIAETFLDRLTAAVSALPVGDPGDERTVIGPLITPEATARVEKWIEEAVAGGAILHTGGTGPNGVVRGTVLSNVDRKASLMCQEVFGPVVSVTTVSDLDEAITEVNTSDFGLNTAIYTRDTHTALQYARRAHAGTVMVNAPPSFRADHMPYGGVKDSGQGREGVPYAVKALLEAKLVVLRA